jgi:hypothetical protein
VRQAPGRAGAGAGLHQEVAGEARAQGHAGGGRLRRRPGQDHDLDGPRGGLLRAPTRLAPAPSSAPAPALPPTLLPLQACRAADFVVEAVSEDEELKRSIFQHLDKARWVLRT